MPRPPPCALTHLNHNKMLASTMQHSTHNHTPIRYENHHVHTERVRNPEPGAAPQENTRCLLWTQQCAEPRSLALYVMVCVPPSRIPSALPQQVRDPEDAESEIRTTATNVRFRYAS